MKEELYNSSVKYIPPTMTKVDDSYVRLFMGFLLCPLKAMKINETRQLAIKNTKLLEWIIHRGVQPWYWNAIGLY